MKEMTKRKYFSINVFLSAIITIVYVLSLIFLFREQAKYDGVVNVKYVSDLPEHIYAGLQPGSAYSLMYVILGFLWKLPHRCFLISLTLTLFSLLSIYFTFILLRYLVNGKISNEKLYLAALICNMSMPVYIPGINEHRYLGMLTFNLYHNSTYIAMKPFALLSLLLFFRLFRKYRVTKISFLEWFCFSASFVNLIIHKRFFSFKFFSFLFGVFFIFNLKMFPQPNSPEIVNRFIKVEKRDFQLIQTVVKYNEDAENPFENTLATDNWFNFELWSNLHPGIGIQWLRGKSLENLKSKYLLLNTDQHIEGYEQQGLTDFGCLYIKN